MAERRREWPETSDFVIATKSCADYDAYAKFDEFDKLGLFHFSEIFLSPIRNIHNFVWKGQKVGSKAFRANYDKGQIDYKPDQSVLHKTAQTAANFLEKSGGQCTFRRDK